MKKDMEKAYEPKKYEDEIYAKWENSGFFNPDNLGLDKTAPSYTIILPPPNITDKLHLGHASMLAIEDLLIRFHRMNGYKALWVPGTDHAAIATQNVVERKIHKEEGKTRHDLGREKFLKRVWDFLNETQSTILKQARKMGASLDWSRTAFTLDEERVKAVKKMFIDMYDEGVIYRGERIVNWCPRCNSTLADDEVEHKEQRTKLYYFKYDKNFPITIATTRPETKLGDTAVAVNPKDKRYKNLIGKEYEVNFVGVILKIKIIADREVDMDFGTGALGVTPAHSMVDWKMAEDNGLNIIKVIGENGKIKKGFGDYSNLGVNEARKEIIKRLTADNLIDKEEETDNKLSVCYRCETPIEPLPSKQWFVSVDKKVKRLGNRSIKEKALEAARENKIRFVPSRFKKGYLHWMDNLHDWCISRQIWFGHRIPAWYRDGEIYIGDKEPKGKGWRQDEDSLDTWFSSGMWTFSTLGWPDNYKNQEKTGDLKNYHPTQVLETGYEILTLWVSRMIMMSLFALEEIPFQTVYLHGMVLDKQGKKMSKSKGNGIDPLDVIESYGTDAVRLSLLIGSTPGNDVRLSEEKIAGFRNFTNKLWNVARYILRTANSRQKTSIDKDKLTMADKAVLQEMRNLVKEVSSDLKNYRFSHAGEKLKEFTWNFLADWYIEATKFDNSTQKDKVLTIILKDLLKLWHPFIPFVTEVIWQELSEDEDLIISKWPGADKYNKLLEGINERKLTQFNNVVRIIQEIRNARTENKIQPGRKVKALIDAGANEDLVKENEAIIKGLRTGIEKIEYISSKDGLSTGSEPAEAIKIAVGDITIYLLGAIDKEKEKERIKKEIERLGRTIEIIEKKLKNKEFIEKAPTEIVNKEKAKLSSLKKEREELNK